MANSFARPRQSQKKDAVFVFGRFNPPHKGHLMLIEYAKTFSDSQNSDLFIFPSIQNPDNVDFSTDPLSYEQKLEYLKLSFPKFKNKFVDLTNKLHTYPPEKKQKAGESRVCSNNVIECIVSVCLARGYDKVTLFVGDDKNLGYLKLDNTLRNIKAFLQQQQQQPDKWENVDIKDLGEKIEINTSTPRGTETFSATKMRAVATYYKYGLQHINQVQLTNEKIAESFIEALKGLTLTTRQEPFINDTYPKAVKYNNGKYTPDFTKENLLKAAVYFKLGASSNLTDEELKHLFKCVLDGLDKAPSKMQIATFSETEYNNAIYIIKSLPASKKQKTTTRQPLVQNPTTRKRTLRNQTQTLEEDKSLEQDMLRAIRP